MLHVQVIWGIPISRGCKTVPTIMSCKLSFATLNVTTSGRNCNTIFDVLTSKMPNADRSKHAFVCVGDFVLIKSEFQINMIEKIVIYGLSFSRTLALNSASHNVPSAT